MQDVEYEHSQRLRDVAKELKNLSKENINELDIKYSVSALDDSRRNKLDPMAQGLPLKSKNIFVDIIQFAMKENRDLLFTILKHTTTAHSEYDESTIFQTAYIYMLFASKINSNCNTFKKLMGLFLQASCLTLTKKCYIGILILKFKYMSFTGGVC